MGKQWKKWQTLFSWAPKSLQSVTAAMKLKYACSLEESYDKANSILKSRDTTLPTKACIVKAVVFPVVMYGYEIWTIKKVKHQRIDAFELWCCRRLLCPLDFKEIKPVNPTGNQPWIFIGRTDAELKVQHFGHLMRRTDSLGKTLMLGKIEGRRKRGQQRRRLFGWHHLLNGHGFEQAFRDGKGQGGLACCSP